MVKGLFFLWLTNVDRNEFRCTQNTTLPIEFAHLGPHAKRRKLVMNSRRCQSVPNISAMLNDLVVPVQIRIIFDSLSKIIDSKKT